MKRILLALTLTLLTPLAANAQIYPLNVYATEMRAGTGQPLKFMTSPANGVYVGLCNMKPDGQYLCDLAKDGTYKTESGLTFRTKNMGQLFSADGRERCRYVQGDRPSLDCD